MTAMGYDWVAGQPGRRPGACARPATPRPPCGSATSRRAAWAARAAARGLGRRRPDRAQLPLPRRPDRHRARRAQGPLVRLRRARRSRGSRSARRRRSRLPRAFPNVRDVEVYLGWFGGASRPMQAFSLVGVRDREDPGRPSRRSAAATGRFVKTSTGGPDEEARAGTRLPVRRRGAGREPATCSRRSGWRASTATRSPARAWPGPPSASPPGEALGGGRAAGRSRRSASTALEAGVAECGIARVE